MTKLGITRLPGESEDDFRRRYGREKKRLYDARKPKSDRKRGKGKAPLKNSRFTQEEWGALQQRPGEPDSEYKRRRQRETMKIWRAREGNSSAEGERRRQIYAENADELRARARAKHAANPQLQREYDRRQREKDPEKAAARIAALKAWRDRNPERIKERMKAWNDANRALLNAYSAGWRRECRIATPPWADFEKIKAFYEDARWLTLETGIAHEVDHMVPVRGRGVKGFHVHTNLRVIPATKNSQKHNRLDHDLMRQLYGEAYSE